MSRRKSDGIDPSLIIAGIVITGLVAFLTVAAIATSIGNNVTTLMTSVGASPETAGSLGGLAAAGTLATMLLAPVLAYLKWR